MDDVELTIAIPRALHARLALVGKLTNRAVEEVAAICLKSKLREQELTEEVCHA